MKDYDSTSLSARRWSEQVLDISDGVDRIRLLKHLTAFDYVVPADHVDAMQILINPMAPSLQRQTIERADLEGRRDRLATAVASFAHSYFKTPPSKRRTQWTTLRHQCEQFPALLRWLDDLAPALDLGQVPRLGDEVLNQLVERCCQAFVARSLARARLRQEIILMYCQDPFRWLAAIRRLVSEEAQFTSKVAPWLNNLPDAFNLERDRKQPLSPVLEPAQAKPALSERQKEWGGWAAIIAPLLIGAAIKLIGQLELPKKPRDSQPSFQQDQLRLEEDAEKLRQGARLLQQLQRHRLGEKVWPSPMASPQLPDIPPPPSMPEE